ncbi:FxSxx-COOH cyclophane-containing RiPP peptide [Actinokineospora diospyrosa]|uniref:FXSXX-COOH protein n=1 Tax=Actinokineospora diospyrosa TaxID=103728 RepID=A0ABT1I5C6_9PSEU|nr:FxSxx-COOH cyclophane-containing RiPP peptide [Actinokineospora diospyrosa]MCP2267828.1 FXSXX-COOH protein [Actinokineospora diospyrosa]
MDGSGIAPDTASADSGPVESGVLRSHLLDVSDIDFAKLAALPECVLRESLAGVLGRLAAVPDRYQAHQSSLSGGASG